MDTTFWYCYLRGLCFGSKSDVPGCVASGLFSVTCGEDSGDHWSPGSGLPDDLGSSVTSDDLEDVELIVPFRKTDISRFDL